MTSNVAEKEIAGRAAGRRRYNDQAKQAVPRGEPITEIGGWTPGLVQAIEVAGGVAHEEPQEQPTLKYATFVHGSVPGPDLVVIIFDAEGNTKFVGVEVKMRASDRMGEEFVLLPPRTRPAESTARDSTQQQDATGKASNTLPKEYVRRQKRTFWTAAVVFMVSYLVLSWSIGDLIAAIRAENVLHPFFNIPLVVASGTLFATSVLSIIDLVLFFTRIGEEA